MQKIKRFLINYFGITPREANGFLAISIIIVLVLCTPIVFKKLYRPEVTTNERDKLLLDSLVAVLEQNRANNIAVTRTKTAKKKAHKERPTVEIKPFDFDPNSVTQAEWERLGLAPFLAKRIINYRNKGGSFRYKSDLLKIYDFPDATYQTLESYIQLPVKGAITQEEDKQESWVTSKNDTSITRNKAYSYSKPETLPFELNAATAEELKQINGIGEKLSARIIDFRNKLGGFYNKEQVRATYGLDSAVCTKLLAIASLDTSNIQKILINSVSEEELKNHPYISYNLAKVIVKFREQHGDYQDKASLKKIRILKLETLEKLSPYLSFE